MPTRSIMIAAGLFCALAILLGLPSRAPSQRFRTMFPTVQRPMIPVKNTAPVNMFLNMPTNMMVQNFMNGMNMMNGVMMMMVGSMMMGVGMMMGGGFNMMGGGMMMGAGGGKFGMGFASSNTGL